MRRRDLLTTLAFAGLADRAAHAQDVRGPGRGPDDDARRNAELLADYDYSKYVESLTGYAGQDLQRIGKVEYRHAIRTRVGPRGNYKAGMACLKDGTLIVASCRFNNASDHTKRDFDIHVYESRDVGLTWQEIGRSALHGKEPSLTLLPDDSLVLTAQDAHFSEGTKLNNRVFVSRSADGGRTWTTVTVPGTDYPRNLLVEPDGALLMIRALDPAWWNEKAGSPNLEMCRSTDGGKTWTFSEGAIDWDYRAFGEVSSVQLNSGNYLAALRRQSPGTSGEGFEETVLTESSDGGRHWSTPRKLSEIGEVHLHLLRLRSGRLLATRSNYHLPFGVCAVTGSEDGREWDWNHPYQLAISAGFNVGWPITIELPDSLITVYGATTYLQQPPYETTCETVRWRLD